MPYAVSVEASTRTIVITGTGHGTTDDTIKLIHDVEALLTDGGRFSMLYDALDLEIESSPADMMRVAGALFQMRNVSYDRIAVVVPPARRQLAMVFAALANDRNVKADVFGSAAEARRWLNES